MGLEPCQLKLSAWLTRNVWAPCSLPEKILSSKSSGHWFFELPAHKFCSSRFCVWHCSSRSWTMNMLLLPACGCLCQPCFQCMQITQKSVSYLQQAQVYPSLSTRVTRLRASVDTYYLLISLTRFWDCCKQLKHAERAPGAASLCHSQLLHIQPRTQIHATIAGNHQYCVGC